MNWSIQLYVKAQEVKDKHLIFSLQTKRWEPLIIPWTFSSLVDLCLTHCL